MIKVNYAKIMEYDLCLLIFLLPWQTRWMIKLGELNGGYWEYGTMSIYFTDILLLLILLVFIIRRFFQQELRIKNYELRIMNFWWLIGGLELFIFISIFFATDWKLALYGYGRFLLAIGLFFLLTQIKYDKIKLYWSIVAAGCVQSVLAMQQMFTQRVFASKWLGMAAQDPASLGVSVVETELRRWLRAYGSLPHPNMLGGFLVVCLLINIILYFALLKNKNERARVLSLVFFIINFVSLLLTFSRAAWLGLAIGIIVLIPLVINKYGQTGLLNLSKFVFIIVMVSSIVVMGLKEPIFNRFNDNRLEIKSVQERIDYNKEAGQIIKNNWLFGVGIKNYTLAIKEEIDSSREVFSYQPVHNVFLLVWAETGILGLIFFIGLLIYLLVELLKGQSYGKVSLVFAITVMMLFDHWWWSMGFGVYLFWMVLGMSTFKHFST